MRVSTRAVVIGSPVSHSLSPAMYNACFAAESKNWEFGAVDVALDALPTFLDSARRDNIAALSVTMPLKEAIVDLLDVVQPEALALHAVNAVVRRDGILEGFNTDGAGCCDALERVGSVSLRDTEVAVLGAGGTARSVALELVGRGAHVHIVNRSAGRADELVRMVRGVHPSATLSVDDMSCLSDCSVVVNTTSVGMNEDVSPVPEGILRGTHIVLDAVYTPLDTRLLSEARAAGAKTIDGLWMLVYQGCRQYELWFGERADAHTMRTAAEKELASRS